MKRNSFTVSVATLGIVGSMLAPGTIATALALPLVYAMAGFNDIIKVIFVLLAFGFAYGIIEQARHAFTAHDPSDIVLDEVIGCLVTFCMVPFSWPMVVVGFILFRFFDITKPWGVRHCENLHGAWGILLDDVAAGIISNFLLQVIVYGISNSGRFTLSNVY